MSGAGQPLPRVGDLQIVEDLAFQRRSWIVQRVGWVMISLVVGAACLGAFGRGVFNRAVAADHGLRVEYPRFWRLQSPVQLSVHVPPEAVRNGEVRLWIPRAYLDRAWVARVTPEPRTSELDSDRIIYRFAVRRVERPVEVTFELEFQVVGTLAGRLGVDQGAQVAFRHFIYP